MDWTDCSMIEVMPGRMSGAPVLRNTRVRPQDLLANVEQGPEWLAAEHGLDIDDVRAVLDFWAANGDELPLEYIPSDEIAALGAGVDWSGCPLVEAVPWRMSGVPVLKGVPVRTVDLIAHRAEGVAALAEAYGLPMATVQAILAFHDRHKEQLAPAV